ncbi:MAG: SMI1/KNR4 family protein, partial [Streptomyces sp.]|uniref:SMI1/KNR4 family protein n=1 Tax=Streptomyces sp. TaxID=1931 RepID=UPI003D6C3431
IGNWFTPRIRKRSRYLNHAKEVTMWRDLVQSFGVPVVFGQPTPQGSIESTESRLEQSLPEEIRSLLIEMNGLTGRYGIDIAWTAERIAQDNEAFRITPTFAELYSPFNSLIFFGDNGSGDQFAYQSNPPRPDILVWDHETDKRKIVAPSLRAYLTSSLQSNGEDWYR